MNENQINPDQEERDALCPECGHAFKVYVDRIMPDERNSEMKGHTKCPVCGCGQCDIIHSGT